MMYRVFWAGEWPKPKRIYHPGKFKKRRQARQWCRNRNYMDGFVIEHPNGTLEPFVRRGQ